MLSLSDVLGCVNIYTVLIDKVASMKKIALALCATLGLVSCAYAAEEKSFCIANISYVHVSIDNQFDQDLLLTTL